MTIALFGGTGRAGRRVLGRLLVRGERVQALARDPSRLPRHPGVTAIAGDTREVAAITRTVEGARAIVICLGMDDISRPSTTFSEAVRAIVAQAKTVGVRRIVAIASAGALDDPRGGLVSERAGAGPFAHIGAEHARNYRTLATSDLDWTLMCAVDLVEDISEGHARWSYEALPEGSGQTGYEDLAATIVALIDEPASFGHRVGIVSIR
jgi:uncharacterized protein YbjT (DUF2867 family)